MANPTSNSNADSYDFGDMELRCGKISVSGTVIATAQQDNVADSAAATAVSASSAAAVNPTAPTDFTPPLAAQAVAVVSEAATDLDDVASALETLRDETAAYELVISNLITDDASIRTQLNALIVDVADIRTQLNVLITALESAGILADA